MLYLLGFLELALGNGTNTLSALAVALLTLLPGLGIAYGLGRRDGWSVPAIVVAAFAFGAAAVSVLSLAAHYLGLSLTFVLWATVAVSVGLYVAGFYLGRGHGRPRWAWQGLALGGLAAMVGIVERPWMSWTSDTFYHLAAARSLLHFDRPIVTDPFFGAVRGLDPTSGVWHTMLALWSKLTGLDVIWFWAGALAVGAAIVVMSFWLLARFVSGSDLAASVATAGFVVFALYADFRQYAQPNRVSMGLAFAAVLGMLMLSRRPRWSAGALAVAASFATFSMHLASAELVLIVGVVLVTWMALAALSRRLRTGEWKARGVLALLGTGVACLVTALPVILPKAGAVGDSNVVGYASARLSGNVLQLGPMLVVKPGAMIGGGVLLFWVAAAVALVAGVLAFRRDDFEALAVLAITGLPVLLLLDPLVSTILLRYSYYLTARIAVLLRFTPYIGVAWALGRPVVPRWRYPLLALGVATLVAALVPAPPYLASVFDPRVKDFRLGERYSFPVSRRVDQRDVWGRPALKRMRELTGDGYPVVASDTESSYYLPGLLPVAVVSTKWSHMPFTVPATEADARTKAVNTVMDANASEPSRAEALRRWHARYVLITPNTPKGPILLGVLGRETGLLRLVMRTEKLALFEVR